MVDTIASVSSSGDTDLIGSFRQKANFMKSWKPGSVPSNRDKLELYALHKQAISGNAPDSLSTQSAAERAKYQAWRGKLGLSSSEAMRLYIQESERQLRVYGTSSSGRNAAPALPHSSTTPLNTPAAALTSANNNSNSHSETNEQQQQQPRGLAAIPLLCAAASESRQAYLRRLANTRVEQAWWGRQEPLTATPGSVFALPEALVLGFAALIERISLTAEQVAILQLVPIDVIRSLLWPLHNSLLSLWMAYILVATEWTAAMDIGQTIVWGSRRTGLSLDVVWKEQVLWCAQSVGTLTEPHQPLTARLTGLCLWPYALLVSLANAVGSILWKSLLYTLFLFITWWYWWIVLPWFGGALLVLSMVAGNCFAIIELAGA